MHFELDSVLNSFGGATTHDTHAIENLAIFIIGNSVVVELVVLNANRGRESLRRHETFLRT